MIPSESRSDAPPSNRPDSPPIQQPADRPASRADITVWFDGVVSQSDDDPARAAHPPDEFGRVWKKVDGWWMLRYYGRTGLMNEFLIAPDGSQIRISQTWPEWRDTLFPLINPAFAAALSLMGHPVLHASSLVHRRGAFLVMGVSGAGKSTLSTALAAEGLAVHSDDIAVLDVSMREVAAGYPRIKVDPELPGKIGLKEIPLLPVFATSIDNAEQKTGNANQKSGDVNQKSGDVNQKPSEVNQKSDDDGMRERWIPADALPGGFHDGPAPLKGIFVLSGRQAGLRKPKMERLKGMSASIALIEHLYGPNWLHPPSAENLRIFTHLAATVPVFRVTMPDDLAVLRESAGELIAQCMDPVIDGEFAGNKISARIETNAREDS